MDVSRGSVIVPKLPGLGVSIDEKAVHTLALARTAVTATGSREMAI